VARAEVLKHLSEAGREVLETMEYASRSLGTSIAEAYVEASPVFHISPEMFRERTREEMQELRRAHERERAERYRGVYTSLGLRVIANKDGTLELIWRAGKGVSEVCASPRYTFLGANGITFRVRLDLDGATTVRLEANAVPTARPHRAGLKV
jgi:hypothetical protein